MLLILETIFFGLFIFSLDVNADETKSQSRLRTSPKITNIDFDAFKSSLCDEEMYSKKFSKAGCLKLPNLAEIEKWYIETTDKCSVQCEKQTKPGCEMNKCLQTCDNDSRTLEMGKDAFKYSPDDFSQQLQKLEDEAKLMEAKMKGFLDWFCNDIGKYKGKDMHSKAFPNALPEFEKKYGNKYDYNNKFKMRSQNSLCLEAKSVEQLKKLVNSEFNACVESCKAKMSKISNEVLPQPSITDMVTCGDETCQLRCAGQQNAGLMALDVLENGLKQLQ